MENAASVATSFTLPAALPMSTEGPFYGTSRERSTRDRN